MAIGFFSSRRTPERSETDTVETQYIKNAPRYKGTKYHNNGNRRYNKHIDNKKGYADRPLDSSMYGSRPTTAKRQPLVVELNSADTLTLQLLHGIGPTYARRIVRYRDRLGGFTNIGQLLEVYGFTPELLEHIGPSLTLDTTDIRRIDINSVELKQLIKHPYIEYYQARDIVRLRNKGVVFRTADDLRAVPSMADSTLERLLPYISFGE
jgi:competence ComEA-like helix-hairpin-helix protein